MSTMVWSGFVAYLVPSGQYSTTDKATCDLMHFGDVLAKIL